MGVGLRGESELRARTDTEISGHPDISAAISFTLWQIRDISWNPKSIDPIFSEIGTNQCRRTLKDPVSDVGELRKTPVPEEIYRELHERHPDRTGQNYPGYPYAVHSLYMTS